MKKVILIISVLAILAFAYWLARDHKRDAPRNTPHQTETERPAANPQSPVSNITSTASTARLEAAELEAQRPADADDEGWEWILKVRRMMLEMNQPVEFYLRVIDQHDNPVAGAGLTAALSRVDENKLKPKNFLHLQMGDEIVHEPLRLESDTDGWIRFHGRTGKAVFWDNLAKEGYLWSTPLSLGSLVFEPGKRRALGSLEMADAFDPSKGYTFHMWKKGEAERLVPISIGVNLDVKDHGEWVSNYFVRFLPPKVEWTNFAGADLMIQGIRRLTGDPNRRFEFTFTMSVPSGGILFTSDAYPYRAPSGGYQTSWSFENKPQNYPPDFPWTKAAYVKLRGGAMYAGLQVGFCSNTGFNFSFTGYLNPTGSRNLEPDPEKLITDPEEIRRIDEQTRVN
jgi:hypothetical protein